MSIKLEKLERKDFQKIKEWIDPTIFRIFKEPLNDQQLEILLSKAKDGTPTDIGMHAVDTDNNKVVGVIHAVINNENDYAHIQQILVDPDLHGRGYGSTMIASFIDLCFNSYNLHRVQIFTDEDNSKAISCYKKLGLHLDGLMRDTNKSNDGYFGTYIFSILIDEWQV